MCLLNGPREGVESKGHTSEVFGVQEWDCSSLPKGQEGNRTLRSFPWFYF